MTDADEILTARLVLTPLVPANAGAMADAMADVLADPAIHEFIGGEPLGLDELRDRYEALAAGSGREDEGWLNWIVHTAGGTAVGTVQATVTPTAAEVAWVIGTAHQGNGYASEAAAALVAWLRDQGAPAVRACIHPHHHASMGVARHAGLHPTDEVEDGETVWGTAWAENASSTSIAVTDAEPR